MYILPVDPQRALRRIDDPERAAAVRQEKINLPLEKERALRGYDFQRQIWSAFEKPGPVLLGHPIFCQQRHIRNSAFSFAELVHALGKYFNDWIPENVSSQNLETVRFHKLMYELCIAHA